MNFTTGELIDMVFVLGESDRNCVLAKRIYNQRYPERRIPDKKSFEKLLTRFNETGNVAYKPPVLPKRAIHDDNQLSVILAVEENPNTSQQNISELVGISERSVGRILKQHNYHPYKIHMHQELKDRDFEKRMRFCNWAKSKLRRDPAFFERVLFSDEASFQKNGFVNRHNFHYYATENPHIIRETHSQDRWSVNVWGGIIGEHVIGPHFFEGNLNGLMYLDFLANYLPLLLENVPLAVRQSMWYQHDGAGAHYLGEVADELHQQFPNRWIGRNGPKKWPARSPDLTKPDFFKWGYVKDLVYQTPPTTPEDMKERIVQAFRSITPEMLRNVSASFNERVNLCIRENGRHFEHLL